ncbi:MAG: SipW-dependent-type signal peptide-containing protein [Clostridia bacterium]|nr:SipW-dependent-type signal peptide-containing protein [Clostridia bacterium]
MKQLHIIKKGRTKEKLLLLSLILAVFAMLTVGTYAYFTTTETAHNVITTGGIRFELRQGEAATATFPEKTMVIMPGDVVNEDLTVENTGDHPMYLRVKLTPGVNDRNLSAENCIQLNINREDWTLKDGYYYYNTRLEAGQTTAPLFTAITFVGKEVTNEYLGKSFSLDVAAFAVQSEHNGATPLDAQGWPEK